MRALVALLVFVGLAVGTALPARIARAQDSATEIARMHFQKGQRFFDVGRWDEAAAEFEKAYAVRSDPTFLYNMAQSFRRKGDTKRAIDLYKNYLIKAPKSPMRPEVEDRIQSLQKQIDESEPVARPLPEGAANAPAPTSPAPASLAPAAPAPAAPAPAAPAPPANDLPSAPAGYPPPAQPVSTLPPPAPAATADAPIPAAPVPPAASAPADDSSTTTASNAEAPVYLQSEVAPALASPGHSLRVAGVVCGVAGVAAIGAGIFFGIETKSYSDSVENGSVFNPNFQDRGKLYETLQWVGYGLGTGLVATGAVLYGIGVVSTKSPAVAIAPAVFPRGAGLSAQGVF